MLRIVLLFNLVVDIFNCILFFAKYGTFLVFFHSGKDNNWNPEVSIFKCLH